MNIKDFFSGLSNYSKVVVPNFRPASRIIADEAYVGSRPWKGIVLHHSATVDGRTSDWEGIRRYHMSYRIDGNIVTEEQFKQRQMIGSGKLFEKPWVDIGYHGGWELVGDIYVFKMGRPWSISGAHAGFKGNSSYNDNYLGLCAVGNYDKVTPPEELWKLSLATVREIMQHFRIPSEKVIGHREVYDQIGVPRQKTCPGTSFNIDKFRKEL